MRLPNKIERNIAIVVLMGAFVIAASVALTRSTLDSAIEKDATIMAQGWADYLARTLPDIEAIAEGAAPSMESSRVLNLSREVGSVFRYKIFSRSGQLALISDDPEYVLSRNADLGDHNPTAAGVVATGVPYVKIQQGDGQSRPLHYGEAYVPLVRGGRTVATVEVYVDLTGHRAAMETAFRSLVLKILGGLALAFAIPAAAYALLSRRQADVVSRLNHAARHDELTGVMNRAAFSKRVNGLIEEKTPFAVHYLDLDRFKGVNDTLGHSTGDVVLREVAARLIKTTGNDSFVGRLGGDEFAVCQKTDSASVAYRFAEHLVRALSKPYVIHGHEILIGGSIGFARYPENGTDTSTLLQAADIALTRAKKNGRGRGLGYHESMEREHIERHAIEKSLRHALKTGSFELHYQPLFRTKDQTLRGFEALLRLRDEDGHAIPPSIFIPIAEDIDLIGQIGDWVIIEACKFAATWPADLTVAVNLSPAQFEHGDLVMKARTALTESGLAAERLELEITESLLITNSQSVLTQLHQLRALGIRIALDDFGTGYSSLSYLWQFPFDKLKIDRAFVNGIENKDSKSREILKTVVSLGQVLDLAVTAEGVETEGQLAALKELRCDMSQGFLLGRPMPARDLAAFVVKAMTPGRKRRPAPRNARRAAS